MSSERKEPTVSSVLNTKEDLSDRRARAAKQQRGSRPAEPRRPQTPPPSSSSGLVWFTFLITIVAIAGAGYAIWQLQTAQQVMAEQRDRIVALEKKLTISDDTATQSLESIGVKVRELDKRSGVATSEIDKLWAARNVNRKAIADSKQQLETLQKDQKASQKKVASLDKKSSTLTKAIGDIDTLKTTVDSTSQSVGEQELLIQSLRERVAAQNDTLKQASAQAEKGAAAADKLNTLDGRVKTTEETIKSLEAFRRTTNRDLLKLKGGQK